MSNGGGLDGDRKLELVAAPINEKGKVVSPEEFFQANILPFFRKMADIVSGKDGSADWDEMDVSDRMVAGLKRILETRSLKMPKFGRNLSDKSAWMEGKIAVRLVQNYSCYVLVARDAEDMELDDYAPGKNYYFEAADFVEKGGDQVSYDGKNYWQIVGAVEDNEGKNSETAKNIRKVTRLIRDLLYKTNLKEKKREKLASELRDLRLMVGKAARLVIADLVQDYEEEGWIEAIDVDDDALCFVKDSRSYDKAMKRLIIGEFDLNKFG